MANCCFSVWRKPPDKPGSFENDPVKTEKSKKRYEMSKQCKKVISLSKTDKLAINDQLSIWVPGILRPRRLLGLCIGSEIVRSLASLRLVKRNRALSDSKNQRMAHRRAVAKGKYNQKVDSNAANTTAVKRQSCETVVIETPRSRVMVETRSPAVRETSYVARVVTSSIVQPDCHLCDESMLDTMCDPKSSYTDKHNTSSVSEKRDGNIFSEERNFATDKIPDWFFDVLTSSDSLKIELHGEDTGTTPPRRLQLKHISDSLSKEKDPIYVAVEEQIYDVYRHVKKSIPSGDMGPLLKRKDYTKTAGRFINRPKYSAKSNSEISLKSSAEGGTFQGKLLNSMLSEERNLSSPCEMKTHKKLGANSKRRSMPEKSVSKRKMAVKHSKDATCEPINVCASLDRGDASTDRMSLKDIDSLRKNPIDEHMKIITTNNVKLSKVKEYQTPTRESGRCVIGYEIKTRNESFPFKYLNTCNSSSNGMNRTSQYSCDKLCDVPKSKLPSKQQGTSSAIRRESKDKLRVKSPKKKTSRNSSFSPESRRSIFSAYQEKYEDRSTKPAIGDDDSSSGSSSHNEPVFQTTTKQMKHISKTVDNGNIYEKIVGTPVRKEDTEIESCRRTSTLDVVRIPSSAADTESIVSPNLPRQTRIKKSRPGVQSSPPRFKITDGNAAHRCPNDGVLTFIQSPTAIVNEVCGDFTCDSEIYKDGKSANHISPIARILKEPFSQNSLGRTLETYTVMPVKLEHEVGDGPTNSTINHAATNNPPFTGDITSNAGGDDDEEGEVENAPVEAEGEAGDKEEVVNKQSVDDEVASRHSAAGKDEDTPEQETVKPKTCDIEECIRKWSKHPCLRKQPWLPNIHPPCCTPMCYDPCKSTVGACNKPEEPPKEPPKEESKAMKCNYTGFTSENKCELESLIDKHVSYLRAAQCESVAIPKETGFISSEKDPYSKICKEIAFKSSADLFNKVISGEKLSCEYTPACPQLPPLCQPQPCCPDPCPPRCPPLCKPRPPSRSASCSSYIPRYPPPCPPPCLPPYPSCCPPSFPLKCPHPCATNYTPPCPPTCPPPCPPCLPRRTSSNMSSCPSACAPRCPPTCPPPCPPICPPPCPPPCSPVCPPRCPPPCPPTYPPLCPPTLCPPPCSPKCPPSCLPPCPPTCPPSCLPTYPPRCPPPCPPTCPPPCPPLCPPRCPPTCPAPFTPSTCPPSCPPLCPKLPSLCKDPTTGLIRPCTPSSCLPKLPRIKSTPSLCKDPVTGLVRPRTPSSCCLKPCTPPRCLDPCVKRLTTCSPPPSCIDQCCSSPKPRKSCTSSPKPCTPRLTCIDPCTGMVKLRSPAPYCQDSFTFPKPSTSSSCCIDPCTGCPKPCSPRQYRIDPVTQLPILCAPATVRSKLCPEPCERTSCSSCPSPSETNLKELIAAISCGKVRTACPPAPCPRPCSASVSFCQKMMSSKSSMGGSTKRRSSSLDLQSSRRQCETKNLTDRVDCVESKWQGIKQRACEVMDQLVKLQEEANRPKPCPSPCPIPCLTTPRSPLACMSPRSNPCISPRPLSCMSPRPDPCSSPCPLPCTSPLMKCCMTSPITMPTPERRCCMCPCRSTSYRPPPPPPPSCCCCSRDYGRRLSSRVDYERPLGCKVDYERPMGCRVDYERPLSCRFDYERPLSCRSACNQTSEAGKKYKSAYLQINESSNKKCQVGYCGQSTEISTCVGPSLMEPAPPRKKERMEKKSTVVRIEKCDENGGAEAGEDPNKPSSCTAQAEGGKIAEIARFVKECLDDSQAAACNRPIVKIRVKPGQKSCPSPSEDAMLKEQIAKAIKKGKEFQKNQSKVKDTGPCGTQGRTVIRFKAGIDSPDLCEIYNVNLDDGEACKPESQNEPGGVYKKGSSAHCDINQCHQPDAQGDGLQPCTTSPQENVDIYLHSSSHHKIPQTSDTNDNLFGDQHLVSMSSDESITHGQAEHASYNSSSNGNEDVGEIYNCMNSANHTDSYVNGKQKMGTFHEEQTLDVSATTSIPAMNTNENANTSYGDGSNNKVGQSLQGETSCPNETGFQQTQGRTNEIRGDNIQLDTMHIVTTNKNGAIVTKNNEKVIKDAQQISKFSGLRLWPGSLLNGGLLKETELRKRYLYIDDPSWEAFEYIENNRDNLPTTYTHKPRDLAKEDTPDLYYSWSEVQRQTNEHCRRRKPFKSLFTRSANLPVYRNQVIRKKPYKNIHNDKSEKPDANSEDLDSVCHDKWYITSISQNSLCSPQEKSAKSCQMHLPAQFDQVQNETKTAVSTRSHRLSKDTLSSSDSHTLEVNLSLGSKQGDEEELREDIEYLTHVSCPSYGGIQISAKNFNAMTSSDSTKTSEGSCHNIEDLPFDAGGNICLSSNVCKSNSLVIAKDVIHAQDESTEGLSCASSQNKELYPKCYTEVCSSLISQNKCLAPTRQAQCKEIDHLSGGKDDIAVMIAKKDNPHKQIKKKKYRLLQLNERNCEREDQKKSTPSPDFTVTHATRFKENDIQITIATSTSRRRDISAQGDHEARTVEHIVSTGSDQICKSVPGTSKSTSPTNRTLAVTNQSRLSSISSADSNLDKCTKTYMTELTSQGLIQSFLEQNITGRSQSSLVNAIYETTISNATEDEASSGIFGDNVNPEYCSIQVPQTRYPINKQPSIQDMQFPSITNTYVNTAGESAHKLSLFEKGNKKCIPGLIKLTNNYGMAKNNESLYSKNSAELKPCVGAYTHSDDSPFSPLLSDKRSEERAPGSFNTCPKHLIDAHTMTNDHAGTSTTLSHTIQDSIGDCAGAGSWITSRVGSAKVTQACSRRVVLEGAFVTHACTEETRSVNGKDISPYLTPFKVIFLRKYDEEKNDIVEGTYYCNIMESPIQMKTWTFRV